MIFKTNLTPVSAARFKHWREEENTHYCILRISIVLFLILIQSPCFAPTPSTTQVSHDIQSALLYDFAQPHHTCRQLKNELH